MRPSKHLLWIVLVPLACAYCAWPPHTAEVAGEVIDGNSGRPIGDAFVVVHWRGSWSRTIGGSSGYCYRIAAVKTNSSGQFRIPEWYGEIKSDNWRLDKASRTMGVYKAGYVESGRVGFEANHGKVIMQLYSGPKEDYFANVFGHPAWFCSLDLIDGNLRDFYIALGRDANGMAETSQQKSRALMYLELAANARRTGATR